MTIKDLTGQSSKKNLENKKRFIERYKDSIRKKVKNIAGSKSMKDFQGDTEVTIENTEEPGFVYDRRTGDESIVVPGNDRFKKGDTIDKPRPQGGSRGTKGGDSGHGEVDSFTFTLTKDEFLNLYFEGCGLPNFIKESLGKTNKVKLQRQGVVKEGPDCRLNIKKTLLNAKARKFAAKKKVPFLDDVDLRYDNLVRVPKPIIQAAMFCIMDVSWSMGQLDKELAKKFYLLLYLFLEREYESIDIIFIRHTEVAEEVPEDIFFYDGVSGGTMISSAYRLALEIINDRYDVNSWNLYVAQSSDGDNFDHDNEECIDLLKELCDKTQYFCFLWVNTVQREYHSKLLSWIFLASDYIENLAIAEVHSEDDIYPVFRELFKESPDG